MGKNNKLLIEKMEQIQSDCHQYIIDLIKENKNISYDTAMCMWLYERIARHELMFDNIINKINDITYKNIVNLN